MKVTGNRQAILLNGSQLPAEHFYLRPPRWLFYVNKILNKETRDRTKGLFDAVAAHNITDY